MIERASEDLDVEAEGVLRWRSFYSKNSIVIDPEPSFGQPIAAASGVPTAALAKAALAEGSVARVAALYEVDGPVVVDAVEYHDELPAA